MKLKIEIGLENDVFYSGSEVVDILREVAGRVSEHVRVFGPKDRPYSEPIGMGTNLLDSNGNKVGFAEIVKEDDDG